VLVGAFREQDRPAYQKHAARCESLLRSSLASLLNRKRTPTVVIHLLNHHASDLDHHS
jgi:hypothetical protein